MSVRTSRSSLAASASQPRKLGKTDDMNFTAGKARSDCLLPLKGCWRICNRPDCRLQFSCAFHCQPCPRDETICFSLMRLTFCGVKKARSHANNLVICLYRLGACLFSASRSILWQVHSMRGDQSLSWCPKTQRTASGSSAWRRLLRIILQPAARV